jgi:hypothetical protein
MIELFTANNAASNYGIGAVADRTGLWRVLKLVVRPIERTHAYKRTRTRTRTRTRARDCACAQSSNRHPQGMSRACLREGGAVWRLHTGAVCSRHTAPALWLAKRRGKKLTRTACRQTWCSAC